MWSAALHHRNSIDKISMVVKCFVWMGLANHKLEGRPSRRLLIVDLFVDAWVVLTSQRGALT
jgi:hypothetical protein